MFYSRSSRSSKTTYKKPPTKPTNQAHQASINATDDSHLCVVCMDEERGVLYVPCNHLAVCVGCEEGLATALMACLMCQEPIDRSRSIVGIVLSYM